jgi:hypothetical protein
MKEDKRGLINLSNIKIIITIIFVYSGITKVISFDCLLLSTHDITITNAAFPLDSLEEMISSSLHY